jgi:hypothetical protein
VEDTGDILLRWEVPGADLTACDDGATMRVNIRADTWSFTASATSQQSPSFAAL